MFRIFTFEITVWALAGLYVAMQVGIMFFTGFGPTTEMIHLAGLAVGLVVGVAMLRMDWVDCENWDLFSVWTGRNRMSREELAAAERKARLPKPEELARRRAAALEQFHAVVAGGNTDLALAAHRKLAAEFADWRLPEADLRALIIGALKQRKYADALPLMRDYLRAYTEQAVPMRLKCAEILVRHERRPGLARRVLAKIPAAALSPAQRQFRQQLLKQAEAMLGEGELELQEEDI